MCIIVKTYMAKTNTKITTRIALDGTVLDVSEEPG